MRQPLVTESREETRAETEIDRETDTLKQAWVGRETQLRNEKEAGEETEKETEKRYQTAKNRRQMWERVQRRRRQ